MSNSASNTADQADFVLKHRITGAAFLLFFGALFLPWLLGPPSEALKAEEPIQLKSQTELNSSEIEDELLTTLESEEEESPEQVYISKITPYDDQPSESAEPVIEGEGESVASSSAERITGTSTSSKPEVEKLKTPAEAKSEKTASVSAVPPVVTKTPPANLAEPEKVDVGWVVQVGVFEKAEGAAKEMAELRSQGFSPSTSEMETNQKSGKATRIWLGPFSRRVDAAKARSRLTEKTGKAGYIRAYP